MINAEMVEGCTVKCCKTRQPLLIGTQTTVKHCTIMKFQEISNITWFHLFTELWQPLGWIKHTHITTHIVNRRKCNVAELCKADKIKRRQGEAGVPSNVDATELHTVHSHRHTHTSDRIVIIIWSWHVYSSCTLEMGRMSDYDIRRKPKVWAGSPNECRTFGRMLCARIKQRLLLVSALSGQKML